MKSLYFILFILILILKVKAQNNLFVHTNYFKTKNTNSLEHIISLKKSYNKFYFIESIYSDSIGNHSNFYDTIRTENTVDFGKRFDVKLIAPKLPLYKQCTLNIRNEINDQTLHKTILLADLLKDSIYINDIGLYFNEKEKQQNEYLLYENFADTNIHHIVVKSDIFFPNKIASPLYIYLRVSKKGKPNAVMHSHIDTLLNTESFQEKTYNYISEIPLKYLNSGNYTIFLSVYAKQILISKKEINFQCLRPLIIEKLGITIHETIPESTIDLSKTFVATYDTKQVAKNLLSLQSKVTAYQFMTIQQLVDNKNDTMMKRFFYNFWHEQAPNNAEAAWKQYAEDLNYCTKYFRSITADKARIYLKYGKPDVKEDVPNEPYTIPYEIWQYENINGISPVIFLFIQAGTMGDQKRLLHSTLPAELQNNNWQNVLINGGDGYNRVFEFLPKK